MRRIVSVLSVLGVLVAEGMLTPTHSAQAQDGTHSPTIDKECEPDPVQKGEQFSCTILDRLFGGRKSQLSLPCLYGRRWRS